MNNESLAAEGAQEVYEAFQGYTIRIYKRVNELATSYLKYVERCNSPLNQTDIHDLERLLRQACVEIDRVRKVILVSQTDIRKLLTDSDFERMTQYAWEVQSIVEDKIQRILQHSSRQIRYFPNTFAALEWTDIAQKLRYQQRLSILEIAGNERDAAIKRKRIRIRILAKRRECAMQALLPEIADNVELWNLKGMPLVPTESPDEASVDHPALYNDLSGNRPHPHAAKLGRLVLEYSVMNRVRYADRVHDIISDFAQEEAELIQRLHVWHGMKNMYRPADLREFFKDSSHS